MDSGFQISGLALTGSPVSGASFNFREAGQAGHTVEVSTDLENWTAVTAHITDNGDGTSSATIDFAGGAMDADEPLIGQPKLFIRVVRSNP